MKKCISLILVLTIILGTITCAGFQSVALNSNAENFDSIAFDGTEYYDSVDTTTPNHGYRLDFPEEGYMVINFTFYAPVHMTFEDVWAEEVLDSLSYTTGWQKASPDGSKRDTLKPESRCTGNTVRSEKAYQWTII